MTEQTENTQRFIEISEADLPLHCPMSNMTTWNAHPRVFLALNKHGEALCPYCSTCYKLLGASPPSK